MSIALALYAAMCLTRPSDSALGLELHLEAFPSHDRKELVIDVSLRWLSDERNWKLKNNEDIWIVISNEKDSVAYTESISLKGGFLFGKADEVKKRITVPAPSGAVVRVRAEFAFLTCTRLVNRRD